MHTKTYCILHVTTIGSDDMQLRTTDAIHQTQQGGLWVLFNT